MNMIPSARDIFKVLANCVDDLFDAMSTGDHYIWNILFREYEVTLNLKGLGTSSTTISFIRGENEWDVVVAYPVWPEAAISVAGIDTEIHRRRIEGEEKLNTLYPEPITEEVLQIIFDEMGRGILSKRRKVGENNG